MLIQLMMMLAQDPATPTATQVQAPAAQIETSQTTDERGSRQRREDQVTCRNRAPTGGVPRRNICRTERRARADNQVTQDYVRALTSGSANQELPLEIKP